MSGLKSDLTGLDDSVLYQYRVCNRTRRSWAVSGRSRCCCQVEIYVRGDISVFFTMIPLSPGYDRRISPRFSAPFLANLSTHRDKKNGISERWSSVARECHRRSERTRMYAPSAHIICRKPLDGEQRPSCEVTSSKPRTDKRNGRREVPFSPKNFLTVQRHMLRERNFKSKARGLIRTYNAALE